MVPCPDPASPVGGPWMGKTGGRRLAHLANYVRPCGRPSGDFCSRLFRCSPSLALNLPKGSHSGQVQRSSRGLCASFRHAGVIVPPGEPLGRTSPAAMPRQHRSGGAGSSPRNHRHDRCSRSEELTGSMDQGKGAWRKTRKENTESQEEYGSGGTSGANLSTLSPRQYPLSFARFRLLTKASACAACNA